MGTKNDEVLRLVHKGWNAGDGQLTVVHRGAMIELRAGEVIVPNEELF